MEKVNVRIDKAQISDFRVSLRHDTLDIDVRIDLFAKDKKVTDFSMYGYTESRNYGTGFTVTPVLVEPIKRIAKELERIVVEKYNNEFMLNEYNGD